MADPVQEQEMEIEALRAILMDEFEEIHPSESGLNTSNQCFQAKLSPQDDETDESSTSPGFKLDTLLQASENLGMAMIYTLVTSAKDWLSERFAQDTGNDNKEEDTADKDEIIVPHGEPVTIETFLAWRERFEAELALERAKLLPESALATTKEKKLTGRQWFQSGRASARHAAPIIDGSNDEDEDIDIDDDDFEGDEEDMLEHYLAEKLDSSDHSLVRTS